MRRRLVALLFVFGCLAAGSAQAEVIRFPKEGSPAFMITLPAGWTAHEDQYNGIQLLPTDHRSLVYLSMVRDPQYKDKPLMDLALAIGKPSNITDFPKQEPTALSGRNGTAFLGQMKNDKGTLLDVKMMIIPLEPGSMGDRNAADLAKPQRRTDRRTQSGGARRHPDRRSSDCAADAKAQAGGNRLGRCRCRGRPFQIRSGRPRRSRTTRRRR